MADLNPVVEQEVARRVAQMRQTSEEEIAALRATLRKCQADLVKQTDTLQKLVAGPLAFGRIVEISHSPDPACFAYQDRVSVSVDGIDKLGKIISGHTGHEVIIDGRVDIKLDDGSEVTLPIADVKLVGKDDGKRAIVNVDGKYWEVQSIPGLASGDPVKIRSDSRQIVGKALEFAIGPIGSVLSVTPHGVQVECKGEQRLVNKGRFTDLKEGDKVTIDANYSVVLEVLPKVAGNRFKVQKIGKVTWNDIGGLESAKRIVQDALSLQFDNPELAAHYGLKPSRGFLFHGGPGNGKTLFARVIANELARRHEKNLVDSACLYVKSPEILSRYIGAAEATIRELFQQCREHYREHGYKAILCFDEADALLPIRGTRMSSDIADTIVPMFLGEMDGLNESDTEANPIIVLLTNRADVIDEAIVRPGRISHQIKIDRPSNRSDALSILKIHTQGVPFENEPSKFSVLGSAIEFLFSDNLVLYQVNGEHDFTLKDCVSAAMLADYVERAKVVAIKRDLLSEESTGLCANDFRLACQQIYEDQSGLNHEFYFDEFCERNEIDKFEATIQKSTNELESFEEDVPDNRLKDLAFSFIHDLGVWKHFSKFLEGERCPIPDEPA